ncbi:hypothetical protein SCH01S_49_00030 [Sphingomonas changbaiensis NBRC 104936]|uniref:CENP-V/GFA domain-containing protein n=1 Tax=Sphingomonas changbaiensis NBRC 104936 TaxID=1219043 RepID=A0A0E9MSP2_9SPHN|nr:GFA family protein [Sphingomonas changbaiensis]GAO40589.1 hypothetical protein SCH01S_49_00030 [Sphingomonas changbaiensis NBRC 104936]
MPKQLSGACLCGAVQYAVLDDFEYALNCHCSQCRRATGSAFKPLAGISRSALHIAKGDDFLLIYGNKEAAHDVHCRSCGSLLFSVVRDGAYVHVTMGTLLDTPNIRPSMHIFVASKAPWYEIADGLPQYAELPNG